MTTRRAVLVEDDPEQAIVTRDLLVGAGFQVVAFRDSSTSLAYLSEVQESIDLFVLDRRLPVVWGEMTPVDEVGDDLWHQVEARYPDARIMIFTGFASIEQLQEAAQASDRLPPGTGSSPHRISVHMKSQQIEFRQQLIEYRALLAKLDDIEVAGVDVVVDERLQRLLQRTAYEYQAESIRASPLAGGLTGASVFKCEMRDRESQLAHVVIKVVRERPALGGLASVVNSRIAVATVAHITGLIDGRKVNVLQFAGTTSVFQLLGTDPASAALQVAKLADALDSVPDTDVVLELAELVRPILPYSELSDSLASLGIAAPSATMRISTKLRLQHCDLHLSNVLSDGVSPALIDSDGSQRAASLVDPVTMLLSSLVHPDSPLRGASWPDQEHIGAHLGSQSFGVGTPAEDWFRAVTTWCASRMVSRREFWAIVLAYATRQLAYPDVLTESAVRDRVEAVVRRASSELAAT